MVLDPLWFEDPLAFLLGREKAAHFLVRYYERDPLVRSVSEGKRNRFANLMSIDAFDAIVTGTDLKRGELLLADASRDEGIAESRYIDDNGFVDRGAVAMLYRNGATIILNQAQRMVPALGQLCQGLEHVFSAHVQTNLYLTPPQAKGFPTHFDNHDVFVIQAEGEKLWRLYEQPVDTPYRGERFQSAIHDKGELKHEFVLRRGDCAYIPRGLMHDAQTAGDAASLHITVGLITRTWADLMLEAASEVALRRPEFRRSLPPGYAVQGFDRVSAGAQLASLAQILVDEVRLDPAMDLLAAQFIKSRPAQNSGRIAHAHQSITPSDAFIRAPLVPFRRDDAAGHILLTVPGAELNFTVESGPALARALDGQPFTVAALAFDHGEALVRRLLAYGLICPAR